MKKVLQILIILLISPIILNAENLDYSAKNILLYNNLDNEIIFEKDIDEKVQIASLTKMMSILVSLENIKDTNETIVFPKINTSDLFDYSKVGFKYNEKITYNDLLYSAMLPSAADATEALAILVSGSTTDFVKLMNEKAEEIGLENTSFSNSYGRDNENNYSTASDVLKFLKYALKNKEFYKIFTTNKYILSNKKEVSSSKNYYGKNKNLDYSNIIGSKTGYTSKAGLCMASIFKKENVEYILIVLGSDPKKDDASNLIDTINIANYYYNNYAYKTILNKDEKIAEIKFFNILSPKINVTSSEEVIKYIDKSSEIKKEYIGQLKIKRKNKIGDILGYYVVSSTNKEIYRVEVKLEDNLRNNVLLFFKKYLIFILLLILFIIALKRYIKKFRLTRTLKKV